MNEIVIKKHNFELAKNRLKEFSEKKEAEIAIDKVSTSGGFLGMGNHKVTGYEFNSRIETIQNHLIDINTTNNKTIKEFREIYNALDALDKDYMTSIVASVKAIEKTSNDVRTQQGVLSQHNNKLQEQQNKLDAHQGEIDKIVDNIKKTVSVLKSFKEKLDGLKHLTDIDEVWESLSSAHNSIRNISGEIDSIQNTMSKNQEDINSLLNFMKSLSALKHLMDVDEIWKQTEDHQIRIKRVEQEGKSHTDKLSELVQADDRIRESIDSNVRDINCLKEYKEKLNGISHLDDVDSIWKDVEKHTSQLTESKKRDEELAATIQKNKDEVESKIADAVQTANVAVESLNKRIKYAYLIAGGSAGLAIIELILLLMKVI